MNTELNRSAKCYIGYFNNNPVCYIAVLHFPHPRVKNFKREHRLVVLPDYQGLNIGHHFSSDIAQMYKDDGFRFVSTSNAKSLFYSRNKDKRWAITRKSRKKAHGGVLSNPNRKPYGNKSKTKVGQFGSQNKITYSYEYIGK